MTLGAPLVSALASLLLAAALLRMYLWRAFLFLFPSRVQVEPEAPADQMKLPRELEASAQELLRLGFSPLGSHEEKPPLRPATRFYDYARAPLVTYASLHLDRDEEARVDYWTGLSPGFVVTSSYRRPVLEHPSYKSGGLEGASVERVLKAHLKRLESVQVPPASEGEMGAEQRVSLARTWYQGGGQQELRRQNLAGLLWCVAAVSILLSLLWGVIQRG